MYPPIKDGAEKNITGSRACDENRRRGTSAGNIIFCFALVKESECLLKGETKNLKGYDKVTEPGWQPVI